MVNLEKLKQRLHEVRIALYNLRCRVKALDDSEDTDSFMEESAKLIDMIEKSLKDNSISKTIATSICAVRKQIENGQ